MPVKAKYREAAWSLTEGVCVAIAVLVTAGEALPSHRGIYRMLRKEISHAFDYRRIPDAVRRAASQGLIEFTTTRRGGRQIRVTEKV